MLALCAAVLPAALLSEGYKIKSPCAASTAALLDAKSAEVAAQTGDYHWIAVEKEGLAPTAMFTLPTVPTDPTAVGAPAAVARLDFARGQLDHMRSSIPKENSEAAEVLSLAVEAALEAWIAHCADASSGEFEDLRASSTPFSAGVLRTYGFAEFETDQVDFAALGRGEAIATHCARLPAAILAVERRASTAEDLLDRANAESLLELLRAQPEPKEKPVMLTPPEPKKPVDTWTGVKGFGL